MRRLLPILALLTLASLACESSKPTTRPMSMRERQDRALSDPMNYKPDFKQDRVSSGGITDFDKEGFNKDLKNVLSP